MKFYENSNYVVMLSEPSLYVDNEKRNRSGHMTHAMTELSNGKFIDFNANSSSVRCGGHAAYGYVEYRISEDYGKIYSEAKILPYSYEALMDGVFTVSVEKAVTTKSGDIIAFCLRNGMLEECCCCPWQSPTAIISTDGGESWSEPFSVSEYQGRIYDAITIDGKIYFLQSKSPVFPTTDENCGYSIFTSDDDGKSFYELSSIPFYAIHKAYGSLVYDPNTKLLHAYVYNEDDETHLEHAVSENSGKTWKLEEPCLVDKGSRNPQIGKGSQVNIFHRELRIKRK